jgi:phage FluMu protein Com
MEFNQSNSNQGDVMNNLTIPSPKLEIECPDCKGKRVLRDGYGTEKCYNCRGVGIVISEFGEELLEFIRKYLRFDTQVKS